MGLGTRLGRGSLPDPREQGRGRVLRPTYLSRGSWLLPSGWRRGVTAEGGLGLGRLTAPEAVAGVEALLLRGGGGGLPPLLRPAPLLPALPPAACWPLPRGRPRPRPRGAVGCWRGEKRSQHSQTGGETDPTPAWPPRASRGPQGRAGGRSCLVSGSGLAVGLWGAERKRVPVCS